MKYLLFILLLVAVVITAGCIGETGINLFKPTPEPIPTSIIPDYSNCNGTWYNPYNQTCCEFRVFTRQAGFGCYGDQYLNSTLEWKKLELENQRYYCEKNGDWWVDTPKYYENDEGAAILVDVGGYCSNQGDYDER
jgi:hypothetical protein